MKDAEASTKHGHIIDHCENGSGAIVTNFDATMVWGLVSTVMTVLAIWFLFQPDATAWFAEKKGGNGAE